MYSAMHIQHSSYGNLRLSVVTTPISRHISGNQSRSKLLAIGATIWDRGGARDYIAGDS